MREVKAYLRRTPGVKYVFVDVMCMPLPPHTSPLQRAELTLMLPNVGLLYLGCSVLMLLDASYSGRFWFGYELWLSLQTASTAGLAATSEAQRRCTLVPLEGTPPLLATEMLAAWRKLSSDQAYYRLSQPELLVADDPGAPRGAGEAKATTEESRGRAEEVAGAPVEPAHAPGLRRR